MHKYAYLAMRAAESRTICAGLQTLKEKKTNAQNINRLVYCRMRALVCPRWMMLNLRNWHFAIEPIVRSLLCSHAIWQHKRICNTLCDAHSFFFFFHYHSGCCIRCLCCVVLFIVVLLFYYYFFFGPHREYAVSHNRLAICVYDGYGNGQTCATNHTIFHRLCFVVNREPRRSPL